MKYNTIREGEFILECVECIDFCEIQETDLALIELRSHKPIFERAKKARPSWVACFRLNVNVLSSYEYVHIVNVDQ
jgi:hypothetical protein